DAEAAFEHKGEIDVMILMVENEFALDFVEFHLLPVQFGGNVGLPVVGNFRELLSDVDFMHAGSDCGQRAKVAKNLCSRDAFVAGVREAQRGGEGGGGVLGRPAPPT